MQLEVEVEIQPHKNTQLEGLFKSGEDFVTQVRRPSNGPCL